MRRTTQRGSSRITKLHGQIYDKSTFPGRLPNRLDARRPRKVGELVPSALVDRMVNGQRGLGPYCLASAAVFSGWAKPALAFRACR
jgi:hypothetical protein